MPRLTFSDTGLALTKRFEGIRLNAYPDSAGIWTIGYGHTGPGVFPGLAITPQQADIFLQSDIARAVTAVNTLVNAQINQNQFDALVDFAFNLGIASLANSTLLRYVNNRDFAAAAAQFPLWNHCHGRILPGLLERRQAEEQLFTTELQTAAASATLAG